MLLCKVFKGIDLMIVVEKGKVGIFKNRKENEVVQMGLL